MTLYLVQHGKSYSREEDPERKLTNSGAVEVKQIADAAARNRVPVSSIGHSGKNRALQTAVLMAIALDVSDLRELRGMGPGDDVELFVKNNPLEDNLMLVGHLPFLTELTSHLLTGTKGASPVAFQNGGIVCLDIINDRWIINWILNSAII